MARLGSTLRLLLAALLLGSSAPVRADEAKAPVPAPKADPRKEALERKEKIAKACEAEAIEIRLLDPVAPAKEGASAPAPSEKRGKEAQRVANRIGSGVESESDEAGQTLSRKRGKTSKAKCRTDIANLDREFPGRLSVQPTTVDRVEALYLSRNTAVQSNLGKKLGSADLAATAFDGGFFSKMFSANPAAAVAASPAASPYGSLPPADYGTGRPRLAQYRGALTSAPPQPVSYAPRSYTERFTQGVSDAYEASTAYVSSSLDEAGKWVSGVARSVRNRFYSGIEMIQGYGYKFIHAGRQNNWGTKPLVDGLRRIAAYMRGKSNTDLAIGDISSANGGRLGGHASHQTGRDVDIGFYMTDKAGNPVDAPGFVRFNSRLVGDNGARFDAQRNWMLVQAILANPDPAFKPTNIFIDNNLRAAILAAGADSPERGRAAALMTYWPGHDNHLHLRVQ